MIDINYATLWERVAEMLPDEVAVWHAGRAITYRQLDERAGRLASALGAAGVGPGDKVALYLYNSPEYVEALFAAFKLGAVPVNVNYRYKEGELAQLLADADADALIFHGALADRIRSVVADGRLRVAIVVDDGSSASVAGTILYERFIDDQQPVPHRSRTGDDHLFLYTGGTTGLPKGVVWRQRDLFAAQIHTVYTEVADRKPPVDGDGAAGIARELVGERRAPRLLPLVPLMHGGGLINSLGTLSLGGTVVFASGRTLDPVAAWRLVEKRRVTRMAIAGNAIARPLADELERAARAGTPYDVSSLSRVSSSGAAWTDDVKRRLLAHGEMTLVDVIASSEGGPYAIARVAGEDDLPSRFRLTARARVLDDDGNEIEPGSDRIGTLAYRGPMPLGYYRDPEATAAVFKHVDGDGRHVVPGDLVQVAADGAVEFLGRGATVINTGGEKVFPSEVEQVLLTHPDVVDCAIVGVPDERWGEAVTAVVEPATGSATTQELIDHVGGHLAGYKKPKHVVTVDRLPRGPNGKLNLHSVRSLAGRVVE